MNNYINFEDNIFILNTRIRTVADLLLLDADTDLFLEKTIEDLDFIAVSINLLLDSLKGNNQLISRDDQLNNLYETVERFQDVLFNMQRGNGCFSAPKYPVIAGAITNLLTTCGNQLSTVDDIMRELGTNTIDPRVVSTDELSELLKDM